MVAELPYRPATIARGFMFDRYLERAVLPNGFEIRCPPGDPANEGRRQRIYAALQLINSLDPRRLRRIQRDISRIVVLGTGVSYYWPSAKTIVLDDSVVDRASPALLALTIVHEGVHSRLDYAGFVYFPRGVRRRMESMCKRAELSFAKKLSHRDYPGTSRLIYFIVHALKGGGSWGHGLNYRRCNMLSARGISDELVYAWVARHARMRRNAERVHGISVLLPGPPDNPGIICAKLIVALDLIERTDPRVLSQAKLRFSKILVADLAGEDAKYLGLSHTFLLDAEHVSSKPAWRVAMTLVHQLTHARLLALGIPYNKKFKARVESVCVNREEAFAALAGVSGEEFHAAALELDESFFSYRRRCKRQRMALIRNGLPPFLASHFFVFE